MDTIFWFRRDLRLFNNFALYDAIEAGCKNALFFRYARSMAAT